MGPCLARGPRAAYVRWALCVPSPFSEPDTLLSFNHVGGFFWFQETDTRDLYSSSVDGKAAASCNAANSAPTCSYIV